MSDIKRWYAGKTILLTGVTGLIGKILLEKLLRDCGDVGKIYVIIRPKKGLSVNERFSQFFTHCVFNRLRNENPDYQSKVQAIEGDMDAKNLGLSVADLIELKKNVTMVIHNAACVRFDMSYSEAISSNVNGTLILLDIAKEMPNLKIFVYVSTAYSQAGLYETEERHYPSLIEPYKAMKIASAFDDASLNPLLGKLLGSHLNTYTFSKMISEDLVYQHRYDFPCVIVRPSVVICSLKEPFPTYMEGITSGFNGFGVGCERGVIRTLYVPEKGDNKAMIVPVDTVANTVIVTGYLHGSDPLENKKDAVFYNCSFPSENLLFIDKSIDYLKDWGQYYPGNFSLWFPCGTITRCWYFHAIRLFLFQLVPAFLLDGLIILFRQPPVLLRVQRKIISSLTTVLPFMRTRYWFKTDKNFEKLQSRLNYVDATIFDTNLKKHTFNDIIRLCALGTRRFLLKEPDSGLKRARKIYIILMVTHRICQALLLYWTTMKMWSMTREIDIFSVVLGESSIPNGVLCFGALYLFVIYTNLIQQ